MIALLRDHENHGDVTSLGLELVRIWKSHVKQRNLYAYQHDLIDSTIRGKIRPHSRDM